MHGSDQQATVVIAALPATPLGESKKAAPRRRSDGGKANVNGSSSSDVSKGRNGKRASSSSEHENGRRQSGDRATVEAKDSSIRTRRSVGSAGEVGVSAPMGASAAPLSEERAGDGGGEKDSAGGGRRPKRRRQSRNKDAPVDEKTRISRRVKSMVNRIRQEQNLLDAYAGEGWKGNAREKIRPEKELQRAKMQILRCKIAIRDLIRELDNLALDGSLQESAFDEEGQIFHEEIFCAKCKSQETFTDNDIILCDGACNRGFHQECVDPPLATVDIPPGDEGWLCPVCESKVECLNYINDFLGTEFHVEDQWEKFFSSAIEASERASNPSLGEDWPSEDSDDDDYDPERKAIQVQDEGAEQENGGERSTLEKALPDMNSLDGSDSEPEASSGSGSGSDSGSGGGSESGSSDDSGSSGCSGDELENPGPQTEKRQLRGDRNAGIGAGPIDPIDLSLEVPSDAAVAAELEPVVPVSGKRNRNPVDYKRLHKEMFGEHDDDMHTDDEEWGPGRPGGRRVGGKSAEGLNGLAKRAFGPRLAVGDEAQAAQSAAPARDPVDMNDDREKSENGKAKKMPSSAAKMLRQEFDSGNRFPSRAYKDELAGKLGITYKQVNSWFKTARHAANRSQRRREEAGTSHGNRIGREGVDEMEITNGLLVEKLDEVQMKLHVLKQSLEAMVANSDSGLQPNGKHVLYVPVAEVVEKDAEMAVDDGKV